MKKILFILLLAPALTFGQTYNIFFGVDTIQTLQIAELEISNDITLTTLNILISVNVLSASVEIDLPGGTPNVGDIIKITDSRGNAATNNITIDFINAGDNLHGSSQNYIINSDAETVTFTYINPTIGWVSED
jgi:hypothetical protein